MSNKTCWFVAGASLTLWVVCVWFSLSAIGLLYDDAKELAVRVEVLEAEAQDLRQTLEELEELLEEYRFNEFVATAYAPYDNQSGVCNDGDPNTTSTGKAPEKGTVAVNPSVIPYGSRMLVLHRGGLERGRAEDTGGTVGASNNRIDLFRETYGEAMEFGMQPAEVLWRRP